jgi:hypothetical protein
MVWDYVCVLIPCLSLFASVFVSTFILFVVMICYRLWWSGGGDLVIVVVVVIWSL